jgi:hypothetical protein
MLENRIGQDGLDDTTSQEIIDYLNQSIDVIKPAGFNPQTNSTVDELNAVDPDYLLAEEEIKQLLGLRGKKHKPKPIKAAAIVKPDFESLITLEKAQSLVRRAEAGEKFQNEVRLVYDCQKMPPDIISRYIELEPIDHTNQNRERELSINYTNILTFILVIAMLYHQIAYPQVTIDRSQIPSIDSTGFEPGKSVYQLLGINTELVPKKKFEEIFSSTHPISSTISFSNGK